MALASHDQLNSAEASEGFDYAGIEEDGVSGVAPGAAKDGGDRDSDHRDVDRAEASGGVEEALDAHDGGEELSVQQALDRIGFGPFHLRLLLVCGLGWFSDAMMEQLPPIILPQLAIVFAGHLSEDWMGAFMSAEFIGMSVGSIFWGALADRLGRRAAFRRMLLVTGAGAVTCAVAPTWYLLVLLFSWIGFGIGGNIPCDGAFFVEYSPTRNRGAYLAILSIFYTSGTVFTALMGWMIIPNVDTGTGWRALCAGLGGLCFVAQLFRLRYQETPTFLHEAGKSAQALDVLRAVAERNGNPAAMYGVKLAALPSGPAAARQRRASSVGGRPSLPALATADLSTSFRSVGAMEDAQADETQSIASDGDGTGGATDATGDYTPPESAAAGAEVDDDGEAGGRASRAESQTFVDLDLTEHSATEELHQHRVTSVAAHVAEREAEPQGIVVVFKDLMNGDPIIKRTALLLWTAWFMGLIGYVGLNTFLPVLLQRRGVESSESLYEDTFIYAATGLVGAVAGAFLVETRVGRKGTMWGSTAAATVCVLLAALTESKDVTVFLAALANCAFQGMFAGLATYTPEAFPTNVRASATGIANMVARVGGMVSPMLVGPLLAVSEELALAVCSGSLMIGVACIVALPFETRGRALD